MSKFYWILSIVILFWLIEIINLMSGYELNKIGLLPRSISGLKGILLAPFLHSGIGHLILNTIPFSILGGLVLLKGTRPFFKVSIFIVILGGAGVWLFGRSAYHIGASGLIYGYFGYLVAKGWYEKSLSSIFIALAVLFLYSWMLWGVFPVSVFISWEGHLFGLIAGILSAKFLNN